MINPRDILAYVGGAALFRYGTITRRTAPVSRLGEEHKETWTRSTVGLYRLRTGLYASAAVNVARAERLDLDGDGVYETPGTLVEPGRTNVVLWDRDLTNAAWTKTNVTAAKDQTGIDGSANGASKITASAGNGTCLQAITLASSVRFQSAFVKRVTGSGVINMTMDNGATWTVVTVTAAWTRVTIPTQTLADPTVGFRIVTNGDAIAVDYVQNENGLNATSPITVTTVAVQRTADVATVPYYVPPQALTVYLKFSERGGFNAADGTLIAIGTGGASLILLPSAAGAAYTLFHNNGSTSVQANATAAPTIGQTVELRGVLLSTGSVQLHQSLNGAAETSSAASGTNTLASAWATPILYLDGASNAGINPLVAGIVVRGAPTLTECRDLLPTFA